MPVTNEHSPEVYYNCRTASTLRMGAGASALSARHRCEAFASADASVDYYYVPGYR